MTVPAGWLWLATTAFIVAGAVDVPNSPCPELFRYQQDTSGTWTGLARVPVNSGLPLKVIAELYLTAVLPSKFSGRLTLLNGKEAVLRQMRAGSLNFVDYKIIFPVPYPLPRIKSIIVNNIMVCQGPPVQANVLTTIRLEHSLFPMVTPLSGMGKPEQYPMGRPEDQPRPSIPDTSNSDLPNESKPPPIPGSGIPPISIPSASNNKDESFDYINPNNPFLHFGQPTTATPLTKATTIATPPRGHEGFGATAIEICGQPVVPNELVLNGQRTGRGEWPWIAAIFTVTTIGQEFACSGNLVNQWTVITAAHCIKYRENPALTPQDLVIYLGKYQVRRFAEPYSQVKEVGEIYLHPDYNSNNFDADLAIIILREPAEFTRYVLPICVWTEPETLRDIIGSIGVVVGWGRDEQGNRLTDVPRKVNVPIVSREDCVNSRKDFALITSDRTFCGGFRNDSGPCSGDSGGGLFLPSTSKISGRKQWFLRGIVSLSLLDPETQRCDLHQYIVFTDVAKFYKWILEIMIKTERRTISK